MALHPVTQREKKRKKTGENKVSGFREGCGKHALGCWLLVITQTDRHSQQHEEQTGRKENKKRKEKLCQSQPEISGLEVGWEICV